MNSDTISIQSAYHRTLRCSTAFCDTTHLNQLTSLPNDINHDTENQGKILHSYEMDSFERYSWSILMAEVLCWYDTSKILNK